LQVRNENLSTVFSYDGFGRLENEFQFDGIDDIERQHRFNNLDQRTDFRLYVNGQREMHQTFSYTTLHQLHQVFAGLGALLATYAYDANGNIATITRGTGLNQIVTSIDRNAANMITNVTNRRGTGATAPILSSFVYEHFNDGNIERITENTGRVITFEYGRSGRLLNETDTFGGITTSTTFTYDNFGNRVSREVTGANPSTTVYNFDENNRILSTHTTSGDITDIRQFHYDPNGNMLFRLESQIAPGSGSESLGISLLGEEGHENVWEFAYDNFNRLTGW